MQPAPVRAPRRFALVTSLALAAATVASATTMLGCAKRDKRITGRDLAASSAPATPPGTSASAAGAPERKLYGAALVPGAPVAIGDVLAKPETFTSGTVTVEGHVRKACTRKGCWMELGARDQKAPGARITFKDYGFFVPIDSAGAEARVQGLVQVDTLSAAAVRHYEEEGAVFPGKKPDGTAPEVRLVASGVEMWRSP